MSVRIIIGDVRERLKELPPDSVDCCVTSPPYYGLRDYGVAGQIGLEETPDAYIAELVGVFREVRRVLKPTGTLWLNLGDSYTGANNTNRGGNENWGSQPGREIQVNRSKQGFGCKPKDLLMIPARVAMALQAPQHFGPIQKETDRAWLAALIDGEGTISIARNVAAKSRGGENHCQVGYTPFVSIGNQDRELLDKCVQITGYGRVVLKDRPGVDGRGIVSRRDYFGWRVDATQAIAVLRDVFPFLVAKRKQAVLAYTLGLSNKNGRVLRGNGPLPSSEQEKRERLKVLCNAANQRQPVDMPSFATEPPTNLEQGWWLRSEIIWAKPNPMPESVTDRPTSAHEKIYLLAKAERYFFDQAAVAEVALSFNGFRGSAGVKSGADGDRNDGGRHDIENETAGRNIRNVWTVATHPYAEAHFATFPPALIEPCIKAGCPKGGTVLDPFGGAGTTGLVADRLERSAILIELNPEYAAMAEKRIRGDAPLFAEVAA